MKGKHKNGDVTTVQLEEIESTDRLVRLSAWGEASVSVAFSKGEASVSVASSKGEASVSVASSKVLPKAIECWLLAAHFLCCFVVLLHSIIILLFCCWKQKFILIIFCSNNRLETNPF